MNDLRTLQRRLGVPDDGDLGPVTLGAMARALDRLEALERANLSAGAVGGAVSGGGQGSAGQGGAPTGSEGQSKALPDLPSFFASLRQSFGGLSQEQVDGLNVLLPGMGAWPLSFVSYALATAYHETAHTMQPIHERGGEAYFRRRYDITGNPDKARELGNLSPGDGVKYAGRGYVQLTGKANYRKAEAALGVPLVANPDLAMKADVAAKILVWGMESGSFTGKKLAHYLPQHGPADRAAFKQARRIINGTDRADEIAGIALSFQRALQDGGWL